MAAENGNKYAERWTYDKTIQALNEVHTWALSPDCLYLGHALNQAGLYNDLWAYWRRKWRGNARIITLMKQILQIFEVRLFQNTALGKIPARVGLFALTHHYQWGREYETPEKQQQQRTRWTAAWRRSGAKIWRRQQMNWLPLMHAARSRRSCSKSLMSGKWRSIM